MSLLRLHMCFEPAFELGPKGAHLLSIVHGERVEQAAHDVFQSTVVRQEVLANRRCTR